MQDWVFLAITRMMTIIRLCQWLCLILLMLSKTECSDDVEMTFIQSAVVKGAVCLDGSPPAYQFDKGFGEGVDKWLIHIQGGGWCESTKSCLLRVNMSNGVGSSTRMTKFNFTGVFSSKKEFNPGFYNWNRVIMRYCDGASFTGDVEKVDPATNLHYRGARIFNVILEELLAKGLYKASSALLTGCSSGGLASILHCDKFRARLPSTSQKSEINLPSSCTSKNKPGLCFYPQFILPEIKTPVFVINSAYDSYQVQNILAPKKADRHGSSSACKLNISNCSPTQLKRLQDFRSDFIKTLWSGLGKSSFNSTSRGMFINSCYSHCQTGNQITWLGDTASKLDNKAIAEVVSDWFYERNTTQLIDHQHKLPQECGVLPIR
ncbi:pectin acetylesterase 8-like isoform X2 [Cynara cardunculus var. scolymus]|uniref:pectin acetylesterase 8-like isoform X2 n=1 Tax=Cynara cardunculus var. scolymus TaxID=59895 RepID=UPI000D6277C9|nr:pectin acetylesterase 8-like isoform X2 [Cynara cardunculus var. scolymus]